MQQAPLVAPRHTASLHRAWSMHRLQGPLGAIVNACCALSRAGKGPGRAGQAPATCLPAPPHHACAALYISSGEGLLHVQHMHTSLHAACTPCAALTSGQGCCMYARICVPCMLHACHAKPPRMRSCMHATHGACRAAEVYAAGKAEVNGHAPLGLVKVRKAAGTYSKATGQWRETAVQCVLHCGLGACAPHAITISSCAQTLILIASV